MAPRGVASGYRVRRVVREIGRDYDLILGLTLKGLDESENEWKRLQHKLFS